MGIDMWVTRKISLEILAVCAILSGFNCAKGKSKRPLCDPNTSESFATIQTVISNSNMLARNTIVLDTETFSENAVILRKPNFVGINQPTVYSVGSKL
jgi:hypothetical protein